MPRGCPARTDCYGGRRGNLERIVGQQSTRLPRAWWYIIFKRKGNHEKENISHRGFPRLTSARNPFILFLKACEQLQISGRPTEVSGFSLWGGQWEWQQQLPQDFNWRKTAAGSHPKAPVWKCAAASVCLVLAHPLGDTDIVSCPLVVFQGDPERDNERISSPQMFWIQWEIEDSIPGHIALALRHLVCLDF